MENSLSKYFVGVGAKRLRLVEINPKKSNQHEINGKSVFHEFLGYERSKFTGKFIYLNDNEDEARENVVSFTWYDTREKVEHRGPEWRLYYETNDAIKASAIGDLLIIGKTTQNEIIAIIAQKDSTAEKQLMWLFDLDDVETKFIYKDFTQETARLGFAEKYIISSLGIEVEEEAPDYLEEMLRIFNGKFPSTKEFSEYARKTVKNVSAVDSPDETLISWMDREMLLFKTMESVEVKKKLVEGFGDDGQDVDAFIKYSLGIQNRRKARAGAAFENHLAAIFSLNQIKFSNGKITERNNKPDFIFPGIDNYRDASFDVDLLTMLGLKTTAKDRWRQVLPEADRLHLKHLITLEPSISQNQTREMIEKNLQLIIPKPLFSTYNSIQQRSLINLSDFIGVVKMKQNLL